MGSVFHTEALTLIRHRLKGKLVMVEVYVLDCLMLAGDHYDATLLHLQETVPHFTIVVENIRTKSVNEGLLPELEHLWSTYKC